MWFFMQLSFGTHLAQCVHKESGQTDNFIHERRKEGQDAYQRIQILFRESKTLLGVKHLTLPWISNQLNISLKSKIYFWKSFKTEIKKQCWSPLFCSNTCWMDTWTKACHLAWWAWEGSQCNTCDAAVSPAETISGRFVQTTPPPFPEQIRRWSAGQLGHLQLVLELLARWRRQGAQSLVSGRPFFNKESSSDIIQVCRDGKLFLTFYISTGIFRGWNSGSQ